MPRPCKWSRLMTTWSRSCTKVRAAVARAKCSSPCIASRTARCCLGHNLITDERRKLTLPRGCDLHPVSDDMALCHPTLQEADGRLAVIDAENAWFLRFNHITRAYGTDHYWESICCHPPEPLLMLNMDGKEGATCLIWEHIEDAPGKPCPNPRVIMPRRVVPNVVNSAVSVDIRSFGIRTPPCTKGRAQLRHPWSVSSFTALAWRGSGDWWRRGDTPTLASPIPMP